MSYHQDWLMRQIEAITAMLGYILFHKSDTIDILTELPDTSGENELYLRLQTLVRQGEICQAEDLLFEAMEEPGALVLDAARRFYADLNAFSDQFLTEHNFSRQEIMEGLQMVCQAHNIPI